MFRNIINLIEHTSAVPRVWHDTTPTEASDMLEYGPSMSDGDHGYGFYVTSAPTEPEPEDDAVVLEYSVAENCRILDLSDDHDRRIWERGRYEHHIGNPNMWKLLVKDGIDAVCADDICFYNVHALTFSKVFSGVISDPLEEMDTNHLDEIALGGLNRCTAVTINALLNDFKLRPIIVRDVPVDGPGVLRVLSMKGLSYKPFPDAIGRTVQQFAAIHTLYDWYLLTPGHAMALIRGELFDAENKGPDGRRLEAAFQISRR
jgi:hypothetical protein